MKVLISFILSALVFVSHPERIYAEIINGSWSSTTSLTNQIASYVSTSEEGKLFIFGGANIDDFSGVESSTINPDGSLSSWTAVSNLPETRYWGALAKKEKRIYILGGAMFTGITNYKNTVYSSTIQLDGSMSSWQSFSSLPENRALGQSVIVGNRIYYAGGFNDSGAHNEIYYTNINPDGSLGSWTTSAISLPEPLSGFGLVESGNNLIIVGGQNSAGSFLNKTYKSAVNADGTLGGWQETSSLLEPVYRSGVIRIGSMLLSIGGYNGSFLDKVYYADINSDATLSPWGLSSNHLPQSVCCGAVAASNGYLYLTGGFNGAYLDTVYYAPVNISGGTLNVPYFSQNALPWGPTEYDHSQSLGISNITMDRWGCAVTSAAMALNFHGMTKLVDGTPLDPGSLNDWLKNNKGYLTGRGKDGPYSYLLWQAISQLTKKLFDQNLSTKILMHRRAYPSNNTSILLNDDLTLRKFPDILKVKNASTSSHFVVAKGLSGNTYQLNDPEWNVATLNSFNNSYTQVDRYIPSNTNLSYIVVVVNPNVELLLIDPNGNKSGKQIIDGQIQEFNQIPDATYAFETPISNPNDLGDMESLGTGVNVLLLPEPIDGNYQLLVSGQIEGYTINLALFDQDGNISFYKPVGFVEPDQDDFFDINYSQADNTNALNIVTFQNIITDIMQARNDNLITRENLASHLIRIIEKAESNVLNGKFDLALKRLDQFEDTINRNRGDEILEDAYQILINDVGILKSSL